MKILAVGRNYAKHIEELNNERPDEPLIFTKPDTALLKNNMAFFYPDFTNNIHHEVELIIKICKEGKYVQEKFAHKYYNEVGLGIDFTARDLQEKAKEKSWPWALAKGFNGSAPISKMLPKEEFEDLQNLDLRLEINGETRQEGNTSQMIFSIDYLISYISQFIMLKKGDIIFTGTPAGVGPIQKGDRLEGYLMEHKLLDFMIK